MWREIVGNKVSKAVKSQILEDLSCHGEKFLFGKQCEANGEF